MLLKNFVVYQEKIPYSGFKSLDNGLRYRELMLELVMLVVLEIELEFLEFLRPVWKMMLEIGIRAKLKGENWELQNILDGVGVVTIRLFRAMNNSTITGLNANQFRGQASIVHGNAGVVNTTTG